MDTWKVLEREEGSLGRRRGDVIGVERDSRGLSEENDLCQHQYAHESI